MSTTMTTIILANIPTFLAMIAYFVRLEKKLTKNSTDTAWIKDTIKACPHLLGDHTH